MEPKIIDREAFFVVGLEVRATAETLQQDIALVYEKVAQLDLENQIQHRVHPNLTLAFIHNWSDTEPFTYFLGAEVAKVEAIPTHCQSLHVAKATYAVFELGGRAPHLTEPWDEIGEWFNKTKNRWVLPMNFREYNETTQGGQIYMPIALG